MVCPRYLGMLASRLQPCPRVYPGLPRIRVYPDLGVLRPRVFPEAVAVHGAPSEPQGALQRPCKGPLSEGSRSVFLAKCFFRGLEYQGQNTTHFPEKSGFVSRAAFGGKANKPRFSEEHVDLWPWYQRPPKTQLANKTSSGSL